MPAFTKRAALLGTLMALACGAQAQKTLTLGGSDAIGSILDRQNDHFTKLCNERGGRASSRSTSSRASSSATTCRSSSR